MNYLTKLSVAIATTALLAGCGAEGLTDADEQDRDSEEFQPIEEEITLEDLNFEELTMDDVPYEFQDEYEAFVQETRDERDPRNFTYEVRSVSEQGEDVSVVHVDEEGVVTVLNYMGDTYHNGEDCYSLPASYTMNAALHGEKIEEINDYRDFGLQIGGAGSEGEYSVIWDRNEAGYVTNIRLEDSNGATLAESGSVDGTLEETIELGSWESTVKFQMVPVDFDIDIAMDKQCQTVTTAAYDGGADATDDFVTYDYTLVTDQEVLGGKTVDSIPLTVTVTHFDYSEEEQCYYDTDHIDFNHSSAHNADANYAVWEARQREGVELKLTSEGFLADTETFNNTSSTPIGNGKAQEILDNICGL